MSRLHYLTTRDNARIAYRLDGDSELPLLVLSNSIGTDLHMWDGQMPALTEHFRVLRYDSRGHGASSVPPGPYSLERLGEDVLELWDALHVQRAHFVGLSLGGIVGQWLALNAAERIERLVLRIRPRGLDRRINGTRASLTCLRPTICRAPRRCFSATGFRRLGWNRCVPKWNRFEPRCWRLTGMAWQGPMPQYRRRICGMR